MEKKPKKAAEYMDELNFARFGIVSMNSRVDYDKTSWLAEFNVNQRDYRIEAVAPKGRPHGIDSDTLVALETLFVDSGCPPDNWVHTKASTIRALMGLSDNGDSYHRIQDSIKRLYFTSFILGRRTSLTGGRRSSWDNIGVRFFDGLRYRDHEEDGEGNLLDSEAPLSLRLGEQLADSIRLGTVQVLDSHLLHQLIQPPARVLYRTLQAHRRLDDGTLLRELSVPLMDWRAATGINTVRPEAIRRALVAAHEELVTVNYLESATFEGRGVSAIAHYVFRDTNAPDPALVKMLRQAGVSVARAAVLASAFPERVHGGLEFLAGRQAASSTQIRNPGGLLADWLEHPEKYETAPEFEPPPVRGSRARVAAEDARQRAVALADREMDVQRESLKTASAYDQWSATRSQLRLLLKKHLNAQEWQQLESLVLAREIDVLDLAARLTAATSRNTFPSCVQELRQRLMPLFQPDPVGGH